MTAGKDKRSAGALDLYADLPQFGNSNTNPLRHKLAIDDQRPKPNGRRLSVAVLGVANSGKSTLVNALMGKQVCPSSCKHNTTRSNARAVLTQHQTQIVFLDTPGVVSSEEAKKFRMEDSLVRGPAKSCAEADLLIVLQDVSNRFVREAINKNILRLLCRFQHRVPSILVLNKLDTIPRSRHIYDLIRKLTCNRLAHNSSEIKISQHDPKWNVESYLQRKKRVASHQSDADKDDQLRLMSVGDLLKEVSSGRVTLERADQLVSGLIGWPGFSDVFSISAKNGNGVEDLKQYMLDAAKPGAHKFSEDILVDVDPEKAVRNIVKSRLLEYIDFDVPYRLEPKIENWEYDEMKNVLRISVSIETKTKREYTSLIGTRGKTIALISADVEKTLTDFFDHDVKFYLQTVRPVELDKKLEKNFIANLEKNKLLV